MKGLKYKTIENVTWFLGELYSYDEGDIYDNDFDVAVETESGADSRFSVSIIDLAHDALLIINQQREEIDELKFKLYKFINIDGELDSRLSHMIGRCTTNDQLSSLIDLFGLVIDENNKHVGIKNTGNSRTLYFTQGYSISVPEELLVPGGRAS
jgi:hypothetical protein